MGKLDVDENNRIVCPVDGRKVELKWCIECCAFNGSDNDNSPVWIDCEEYKN